MVLAVGPLVRDLPDVSAGVLKAGRANAPWSINRAVEQCDTPLCQLLAHRVNVVHVQPGPPLVERPGVEGASRLQILEEQRDSADPTGPFTFA